MDRSELSVSFRPVLNALKKEEKAMFRHTYSRRSGFTLIELAIVLGVAGILFGGLWRLLSSSNQQMRDQAAASQQSQLIAAVSAYLQSPGVVTLSAGGGTGFLTQMAANATATLVLPTVSSPLAACAATIPANPGLCSFLPNGFISSTTNSYGQRHSTRLAFRNP